MAGAVQSQNPSGTDVAAHPHRIVIVGGGAAGFAAAETLRREGFAGAVTMLSNDGAMPVDRPNLSKDYLAGNAPEDWLPLRGEDYYQDSGIDLRLNTNVAAIDSKTRSVTLGNGDKLPFDRLLLATGAETSAAGNPGCAIQIAAVSEQMGRPLRVMHPIELIQMSIQGGSRNGKR